MHAEKKTIIANFKSGWEWKTSQQKTDNSNDTRIYNLIRYKNSSSSSEERLTFWWHVIFNLLKAARDKVSCNSALPRTNNNASISRRQKKRSTRVDQTVTELSVRPATFQMTHDLHQADFSPHKLPHSLDKIYKNLNTTLLQESAAWVTPIFSTADVGHSNAASMCKLAADTLKSNVDHTRIQLKLTTTSQPSCHQLFSILTTLKHLQPAKVFCVIYIMQMCFFTLTVGDVWW